MVMKNVHVSLKDNDAFYPKKIEKKNEKETAKRKMIKKRQR